MMATVAIVGLRSGKTIFQYVCHLLQPSIVAASSSSSGMLVLIAPWNMNIAIDTEKPTCIRIRVMRWFRTPSVPP